MVDPKPNLKPNNIDNLEKKWEQDENTLKKILDPIQSNDSAEAWELRNSFLESVKDMGNEIDRMEKNIYELGYRKDDIGMYRKKEYIKEESDLVSNFYGKRVTENRILKLLALNLSGISSKESIIFREKLFELRTHISYLIESMKDASENNEEANKLYEKFLIEWLNKNPKYKKIIDLNLN